MKFPEKHTCHPDMRIAKGEWRPPADSFPYRACDYCGSMHPEDLLAALERGAKLDGADWKYGWPHKFYVTGGGIPHGKFYNLHLLDELDDEARAKLVEALWRHTGVRFHPDAEGLHFDARTPHPATLPPSVTPEPPPVEGDPAPRVLPRVLLVSGARVIEDHAPAREWGMQALAREMDKLPPGSIVVTGDARGPDTWAWEMAGDRGLDVERWCKNGDVHHLRAGVLPQRTTRWLPSGTPLPHGANAEAWRRRFLARDEAMAASLADRIGMLRTALCLFAPWFPTKGTTYTHDRAVHHGALVQALTCPDDRCPVEDR